MEKIALNQLGNFTESILGRLPDKKEGATLIALVGGMGAGKTTFVQALGKALGVSETMQSPTYVLMKVYPIVYTHYARLIHIDAYRLERPEEFAALRPDLFLQDPKNLVCVEWPERVEGMLPTPDIAIRFSSEAVNEGERYIEVV